MSKRRNVVDAACREATPEQMRMEVEKLLQAFLADPEQKEYTFPIDLNNLQRKYIHSKAHELNIISKSHGKPPNRQLQIKKRANVASAVLKFSVDTNKEVNEIVSSFVSEYEKFTTTVDPNCFEEKTYEVHTFFGAKPHIPIRSACSDYIAKIRRSLPIADKREEIVDLLCTLNNNQVVIISSETGSGKTTQVPQYILEEANGRNQSCKIVCTQPRRISAIAAAERVAYERGERLGSTVGYQIKLDSNISRQTCLSYCTLGILLRCLMTDDTCLSNMTHIIIDEIHERDKLSDFLLICIRQHLQLYKHLKVILMSATMNTQKFQSYFGVTSNTLSIPGRLFSIDTYFLEDVLTMTGYCPPKMAAMKAERVASATSDTRETAAISNAFVDEEIDMALDDYMNFDENYDFNTQYEEATAQLEMYFIAEGVSVDYQHSKSGLSALMIAAHLGDVRFAHRLVSMGASFNLRCKFGRTALDFAQISGKREVVALLEAYRSSDTSCSTSESTNPSSILQLYDMTFGDTNINFELIVEIICYIYQMDAEGSILIFLPGYDDIMVCNDNIVAENRISPESYKIFFLHSNMNMREQCDVFGKLPNNQRKIILSTNIAETSITIEDVVFVIDTGRAKEKIFDAYNKMSSLQSQIISKACAKQRQGRAGRVRNGYCFRLFSRERYEYMDEERVPEILRETLEELCLHAKILAPTDMDIHNFLALAPDPPSKNSIKVAIENLKSLYALDDDEDLTLLGKYLAKLSIEPRYGKMLIFGCIFRCLEPILILAASMAFQDPFMLPSQPHLKKFVHQKKKEFSKEVPSDHFVYLSVFKAWQVSVNSNNSWTFCRENFISEPVMNSILRTRNHLHQQLMSLGCINTNVDVNSFSASWHIISAVMCTAYYPNIAYLGRKGVTLATNTINNDISLHVSSLIPKHSRNCWVIYDEMGKYRTIYVRGVTVVPPLAVALMTGVSVDYTDDKRLIIDGKFAFTFINPNFAILRASIDDMVYKYLLNPINQNDILAQQLIISTVHKSLERINTTLPNMWSLMLGFHQKQYKWQSTNSSSSNQGKQRQQKHQQQQQRESDVKGSYHRQGNSGKNSFQWHNNSHYCNNRKKNKTSASSSVRPWEQTYAPARESSSSGMSQGNYRQNQLFNGLRSGVRQMSFEDWRAPK